MVTVVLPLLEAMLSIGVRVGRETLSLYLTDVADQSDRRSMISRLMYLEGAGVRIFQK